MKKLFGIVKRFFLPSDSATVLIRMLPLVTVAFIVVMFFVFGSVAWEYTNEANFCGLTCHTMPPEYTTHRNSAHTNVGCEDCHMGRDKISVMIPRKIMYSWQTGSAMASGMFEYPIVAHNMRPATDACENCHKPEKFSSDALVENKHFASDEVNTNYSIILSLKIGGGTLRQGLGRGIHWHIENPVYFYSTDRERQNIPYVVVTNPDGSKSEFIDTEANFDPSTIKQDQLQRMDCITCHNRVAHGVPDPSSAMDKLLSQSLISTKVPNIKAKGTEVLGGTYANVIAANEKIAGLERYYQDTYADFYAGNKALVTQAIQVLQETYLNTNFPDQQFNWTTHPNNLGHITSPGCMRCHDGKHLTKSGDSVRLECNICHSIPVVASANQVNVSMELNRGFEPPTHENSNWISLHRTLVDTSCKGCHTMEDAGGTSNKSFCSNSACHGTKFVYAGFDAPKVREILSVQAQKMITPSPVPTNTLVPTNTPSVINTPSANATATPEAVSVGVTFDKLEASVISIKCVSCHNSSNGMKGLDLTTYATAIKGGQSGPLVIAGDPANSLLVKVQSADTAHFGQLSPDELAAVVNWITAGAKEK